ncbi:hypothetical protein [Haloplanus sp.]|uniref:hypothetical protein n=1 Tax=Haloplanus sp. TaxID=1961696 RepID=UPI0026116C8D|nr:hypothetical protein [Haloplanus sp.]
MAPIPNARGGGVSGAAGVEPLGRKRENGVETAHGFTGVAAVTNPWMAVGTAIGSFGIGRLHPDDATNSGGSAESPVLEGDGRPATTSVSGSTVAVPVAVTAAHRPRSAGS